MSNFEDRLAQIRAANEKTIREQGYMVENVFATEDLPGPRFFAYTIGLHGKGLPELITVGLPLQVANALVNEVARFLLAQKAMGSDLPSEANLPAWPMPFTLLPADPAKAKELAVGADVRSGGSASYLQVLWPDREGRLPWAPGAEQAYRDMQPVLATIK